MWLGASDQENEGRWIAFDDTTKKSLNYLPWGPGKPDGGFNDNCLILYNSGSREHWWDDLNCSLRNGYICSVQGNYTEFYNYNIMLLNTKNLCNTNIFTLFIILYKSTSLIIKFEKVLRNR